MWKSLRNLFGLKEDAGSFPNQSSSDIPRFTDGYPKTLTAEVEGCDLPRPTVFEPALCQNRHAFRAGEPCFPDDDSGRKWHAQRLRALHLMLERISRSEWADHVVLRGSVLLASWFEEQARQPGDLDWVVVPEKWQVSDRRSRQMVEDIEHQLRGTISESIPVILIPDQSFVVEDIWTYEKAPGKRMIVPWKCPAEEARGTIQLDFVFGERMPSEPVTTQIRLRDLPVVELNAVTPQQSLAWKIVWLETDSYAMGKDLFDAVLLAQATHLSEELLIKTFQCSAEPDALRYFQKQGPQGWRVDWEGFQMEYPQVQGSAEIWKRRLAELLKFSPKS